MIKVSNFDLHDRTRLRTLAVDGDPEILLGAVCLELRVRDDLGHVCDDVGEVEASEEDGEDGNASTSAGV